MSRSARRMLVALQALVLGLPLFLGGRQPAAAACASVVVLVLLGVTLRERRRAGAAPAAPGVAALAVFGVLALATTVPLALRAPLGVRLLQEGLGSLRGAIGTPDQVEDLVARYEAAGVDQVIFVSQAGRSRHDHVCESIELFAKEVLPEFADRAVRMRDGLIEAGAFTSEALTAGGVR